MAEGLLAPALKVVLAVAVGLPLVVYLAQDSLIFYRQPLGEPARAELARRHPGAEEIFLSAADGTRIHAWHVRGAGPLVLYFGGNAEEVSWMLETIGDPARGATPGIGWLLVDYRGYGASGGAPSEKALVADALAFYDHMSARPGVDRGRIYAFGRSLGSGVAVALAAERPLAGVILATPFDSLAAVAKRYYWYLPVDLLLRHRFDSIGKAPRLAMPLLCLIAARDEIIPPVHAERLCAAWGGARRTVLLEEAGHNSSDAHPLFWPSVRAFLSQKVH